MSAEVPRGEPAGTDPGRFVAEDHRSGLSRNEHRDYGAVMASAELWNVAEALVPIAWMAVRHTMTIRANMTAYSTAVGPSSETRNFFTLKAKAFIRCPLSKSVPRPTPDGQPTEPRPAATMAITAEITAPKRPRRGPSHTIETAFSGARDTSFSELAFHGSHG